MGQPEGEIVGYMDAETGETQMLPNTPAGAKPSVSSPMFPPVANQNQQKADLLDKIRAEAIVNEMRLSLMGQELINGKITQVPE